MLLILISGLIEIKKKPIHISIFPELRRKFKRFTRNKVYIVLTLFFWISLFSFFNSTDKQSWQFFTQMKLPFLLLPFAFFILPGFSKKEFNSLMFFYILLMFFSSFGVLKTIFDMQESVLSIIGSGQSIETPVDHIKYSLFVSYAIILGLIIVLEKKVNFFKWEKVPLLVIVVFLFVFLHILAVRSGIVILYFNLLVLFVGRTIQKKEYLKMLVIAVLIFTIPVVAYLSIPTFKQKIEYSILDFKMHQKNKEVAFSDGERFRSYEIGWELFESSPVTGVGVGDIFTDYQALYDMRYFMKSPTNLPHNQFLSVAVSTGVVGLIFFMLAFFFPLLYKQAYKNPFLLTLYVLMLLSFMVENTIERQYSVAFFVTFLLLNLNQIHKPDKSNQENLMNA
jgi:O-antigen ligase